MSLHINRPPQETAAAIEAAVRTAIDGAEVSAQGMGGHFEITVRSAVFTGKNRLARQRIVLSAIAHLMRGDDAPVHAVDRVTTLAPGEAA
jgi:acid stress-induced BolA-like protein IbaG/YrbA